MGKGTFTSSSFLGEQPERWRRHRAKWRASSWLPFQMTMEKASASHQMIRSKVFERGTVASILKEVSYNVGEDPGSEESKTSAGDVVPEDEARDQPPGNEEEPNDTGRLHPNALTRPPAAFDLF